MSQSGPPRPGPRQALKAGFLTFMIDQDSSSKYSNPPKGTKGTYAGAGSCTVKVHKHCTKLEDFISCNHINGMNKKQGYKAMGQQPFAEFKTLVSGAEKQCLNASCFQVLENSGYPNGQLYFEEVQQAINDVRNQ
jgi:hypothetical protein